MKNTFKKMDLVLLGATILMCSFGLLMIFSASSVSTVLRYHVSPSHFFIRQLIFLIASSIIGVGFIMRIPTKRYNLIIWPLVISVIIALI